jgi:hypothetical protein
VVGYIAGIARPAVVAAGAAGARAAGAPSVEGPDTSVIILLDLRAVLAS